MAISRKYMRKIIVEDKLYYYKITHSSGKYESGSGYSLDDYYPEIRVVVESPDGEVLVHQEDWETYVPFTPKHVKGVIKKWKGVPKGKAADC